MIPVDQTIVDAKLGNCAQACVASMLEVPLDAVPNFSAAPEGLFHPVYRGVLYGYGWILGYNAHPEGVFLWHDRSLNDHYMACVPSRNIEGETHAVVINKNGLVMHDPSPHKNYAGENVFSSNDILYFETYIARTDDQWQSFQENAVRARMRRNAEERGEL